MSQFVYDNTSLAFPKSDLSPLPPGANPSEYIVSTDWNSLAQASVDLRDTIRAGKYHGFTAQASDPAPTSYTSSWLWVRSSDGQLIHRRPSGSSRELIDRNSDIVPATNNNLKLGSTSFRWQELYSTDVDAVSLSGGGNQALDLSDLTGTGLVVLTHLLPTTTATKTLGSSSKVWSTGYFVTVAASNLSVNQDGSNSNYILFGPGQSAAVSASSAARLRYNLTAQTLQASVNGGSYFSLFTNNLALVPSTHNTIDIGDGLGGTTYKDVYAANSFVIYGNSNTGYVQFAPGQSSAIGAAGTGRIRYNNTTHKFEASENGGAYVTMIGGGDAVTSGTLAQFAATTSAQLAGVISDETGSGALVFATSPTLVTPTLGVATVTSINKVAITAPASGSTLTIQDGFTLTVSGSATISGTPGLLSGKLSQFAATTSAELAGVISDETGSGALVFATSPTLVTPTLGVATVTTVNKVTITAPASSATLTIADGKTLTVPNNATVTGTNTGDQTVSTMGASGALTDGTGTLLLGHGGTGATTSIGAADALAAKSSNIASASTTDLSTATGSLVHITGTTTITAFGTVAAGAERALVFDGILILTHNSTSLILPGAANITTAVGDCAVFRSEGSGNWRCIGYARAAVTPTIVTAAGAAMMSAASASAQATLLGSALVVPGSDLTDADQTLIVSGGNTYTLQASTLTASRNKTLGVTSATVGEVIRIIRRDVTANTCVVKDDAATVLYTFPASVARAADFRYNGIHFELAGHVAIS